MLHGWKLSVEMPICHTNIFILVSHRPIVNHNATGSKTTVSCKTGLVFVYCIIVWFLLLAPYLHETAKITGMVSNASGVPPGTSQVAVSVNCTFLTDSSNGKVTSSGFIVADDECVAYKNGKCLNGMYQRTVQRFYVHVSVHFTKCAY